MDTINKSPTIHDDGANVILDWACNQCNSYRVHGSFNTDALDGHVLAVRTRGTGRGDVSSYGLFPHIPAVRWKVDSLIHEHLCGPMKWSLRYGG